MTSKRRRRPTKPMEPDDSPESVRRVALHFSALYECQKWLERSVELKRQGKLRAARAATAKAAEFMDIMRETLRGTAADPHIACAPASKRAIRRPLAPRARRHGGR